MFVNTHVPSLWLYLLYFIYYLDLSSSVFDPPDSFGLCQDSALVSSSLDKVSECFMLLCCSDTNLTCLPLRVLPTEVMARLGVAKLHNVYIIYI